MRRSLNYALLTAVLALAYIGAAAGFDSLVHDQPEVPRGLFAVLFAAVSVMLLLPMRDYMQSSINRLFSRSAYDFRRLIETSSEHLASVADLAEIASVIENAVGEALQPEWIALDARVRQDAPLEPIRSTGLAPDIDPQILQLAEQATSPYATETGQLAIPFRVEDRLVALLRLGPRLSGRFYGGDDRALGRDGSLQ